MISDLFSSVDFYLTNFLSLAGDFGSLGSTSRAFISISLFASNGYSTEFCGTAYTFVMDALSALGVLALSASFSFL